VLYAVVDFIVDNYLAVVERLAAEVQALEEHVLEPLDEARIARIYELRRELQRLRLVAAPAVEVCRRLEHADLPGIDPSFRPYYRDVVDHVNRVLEQIDTLREMLSFAFEAGLLMEASRQSLEAARQSEVGRRLAGWAAILAVPTAIAGIYGMNFEHMPELTWRYGYAAVLAVIAVTCAYICQRRGSRVDPVNPTHTPAHTRRCRRCRLGSSGTNLCSVRTRAGVADGRGGRGCSAISLGTQRPAAAYSDAKLRLGRR
jgi:magnesium transporter